MIDREIGEIWEGSSAHPVAFGGPSNGPP
jgi:hypothetical protein